LNAKKRFILSLFLTEALLIGILGSTLGLLIGVNGAYILTSGFAPRSPGIGGGAGAQAHISPVFLAQDTSTVWILSVLLSLAAGLYPAWKAARLSPIEALRR
jgi:putative ABC transport system permease protein